MCAAPPWRHRPDGRMTHFLPWLLAPAARHRKPGEETLVPWLAEIGKGSLGRLDAHRDLGEARTDLGSLRWNTNVGGGGGGGGGVFREKRRQSPTRPARLRQRGRCLIRQAPPAEPLRCPSDRKRFVFGGICMNNLKSARRAADDGGGPLSSRPRGPARGMLIPARLAPPGGSPTGALREPCGSPPRRREKTEPCPEPPYAHFRDDRP